MIPLLILAGGRASRLGALSDEVPKYLMPIDAGRRFADVQLAWVREQGFEDVVLSVGYRAELVRDYVGDGARHGLRVRYALDGATPIGTGGAVKRAFASPPPACAVLYGDTVLEVDCREVLRAAQGAHALMTVSEAPAGHRPNAALVGDLVRYDKANPAPGWTLLDYGLSVLSGDFLEAIPATVPLDLAVPLQAASARGLVRGFVATRPFHEINTPEALDAFRAHFAPGKAPP